MACGDNVGSLKYAAVTWVNELFGPSNPALKANLKDKRGLDNEHTGWLCLGEYDWDDLM